MKSNKPLVFLDLEMTGPDIFNPNHVIYEIGAVRVDPLNFGILDQFHFHCGYDHSEIETIMKNSPQVVREKIKISEQTLRYSPIYTKVFSLFKTWLPKESVLVGYNLTLDFAFLKRDIPQVRLDRFIDLNTVYEVLRFKSKNLDIDNSISLESLSKKFKISTEGLHSAIVDAQICRELFIKLVVNSTS